MVFLIKLGEFMYTDSVETSRKLPGEDRRRRSRTFYVQVSGEQAFFLDHRFGTRSYEIMPFIAARAVIEHVLWKPAIRWHIEQIAVLRSIQWMRWQDKQILRDVSYGISVHFTMTKRAEERDNISKFEAMFFRRLEKQQNFTQPYLGCADFHAKVEKIEDPSIFIPIETGLERPLGLMPFSGYVGQGYAYFDAWLRNGILSAPQRQDLVWYHRPRFDKVNNTGNMDSMDSVNSVNSIDNTEDTEDDGLERIEPLPLESLSSPFSVI